MPFNYTCITSVSFCSFLNFQFMSILYGMGPQNVVKVIIIYSRPASFEGLHIAVQLINGKIIVARLMHHSIDPSVLCWRSCAGDWNNTKQSTSACPSQQLPLFVSPIPFFLCLNLTHFNFTIREVFQEHNPCKWQVYCIAFIFFLRSKYFPQHFFFQMLSIKDLTPYQQITFHKHMKQVLHIDA